MLLTVMTLKLGSSLSVCLMYCVPICKISGDANQDVFPFPSASSTFKEALKQYFNTSFLFIFWGGDVGHFKSPVSIQQ